MMFFLFAWPIVTLSCIAAMWRAGEYKTDTDDGSETLRGSAEVLDFPEQIKKP